MNEPFAFYQQSADYVRARMPFEPQIAVILGSSLGPFAENLRAAVEIDYHDLKAIAEIVGFNPSALDRARR